jgi:hypothetical protein
MSFMDGLDFQSPEVMEHLKPAMVAAGIDPAAVDRFGTAVFRVIPAAFDGDAETVRAAIEEAPPEIRRVLECALVGMLRQAQANIFRVICELETPGSLN